MKTNISWLQKNSLFGYFFLAYAISWSISIPMALVSQGILNWKIPFYLHYFCAYGPMLSAVIMTYVTQGKSGLFALLNRLSIRGMKMPWWFAAFSPLIVYFVLVIVFRFVQGEWTNFSLLGDVNFLPNLGVWALFLWIFTYGLGEEIGWRGYALPRLQKNMSALNATLLLGTLWALWHLPFFFYLFEPFIAIGWFFGLMCGAVLLTWLYNSTDGKLLVLVLWHGAFNFITGSAAGDGLVAMVMSTFVMIWAVLLVFIYKPATLSHNSKHIVE